MSRADITIKDTGGHNTVPTYKWQRDDRDTSSDTACLAGEPVKQSVAGGAFALKLVDADLTIGTDQPMIGVAASDSTETASADGSVQVFMPLPGIVYEIKAKSAAAADTQSEIDTMTGDYQVLDLTSGAYTMDTAGGSGANNAFLIIGGDPSRSSLWFMIGLHATVLGRGSA